MGFLYNRPLSIEQIFSLYNTKGGETIDNEEFNNAKNVTIFNGRFSVKEGMTLEQFESENLETYKMYEQRATQAYQDQQKNYSVDQKPQFGLE